MNFFNKNWQKLGLIAPVLLAPFFALAACDPNSGVICNPLNSTSTLPALIQTVLHDAILVGSPVLALAVIYCGFLFVFARGNTEKITHAKDALMWTLIGGAVLLGAVALAGLISSTVQSL